MEYEKKLRPRVPLANVLLNVHEELWKFRVKDLREFLRISESGLASEFKNWGEWYKKQTKGLPEDQKNELIDFYYDDLSMVRDTVPNLFRHASFVMIVGFFEASVGDICRLLCRTKKVKQAPRQKLYLDASFEYLTSKAGLSASLFGKPWEHCRRVEWLRDAIVHNNGHLPMHAQGRLGDIIKEVKHLISQSAYISLSNNGDVLIEKGFCEGVLEQHKEIIGRLFKAIKAEFFAAIAPNDSDAQNGE